jgi:hypothetical protein
MSSDRKGSVGDATTAQEPTSAAATADTDLGQAIEDDGKLDDPWFTPGPKRAASTGETGTGIGGRPHDAEWFLPTGRAGLHPDVETSFDDGSAEPPDGHREGRVTAAGAPPWAGETTDASASTPPPWETGPWPGPGELRSPGSSAVGDGAREVGVQASTSAAATGLTNRTVLSGAVLDETGPVAAPVRWAPRTVLTAGLIPLVVPGLVVGYLSLRQAGAQAVRKAAWLAIGASLTWAVILIVVVASLSGGSAGSCTGFPAAVHQAYAKVQTDLSSKAPASVQAADLETAASLANSSAASAGRIGVRTALFTLANDMAQARADIVAGRQIPATLQQHLAKDGVVPAGSCAS